LLQIAVADRDGLRVGLADEHAAIDAIFHGAAQLAGSSTG
jgi:hypothetical protein